MLGRFLLSLSCFAIGFVGVYALATMHLGLLIVDLLAIVLLVRYLLPERPTYRPPTPAERDEPIDEALERAREAFLREPSFKAVMPNLGGGQEL